MVFSGVVNTCLKCDMSQWFHCGGTDVVPESSGFLVSGATPEASRRLVTGTRSMLFAKKKNTSINLYEQNPFFEFCFLYQLVIKQTATQSVFLRIQVRASSQTKGLERGRITDFEKKNDCFAV